jgi:hypothetical protein
MMVRVELDELKRHLQEQFSDGLVTIVGSGLSAAAGLPTMQQLAVRLQHVMPLCCGGELRAEWEPVASRLAEGADLESALKDVAAESELIPLIVAETAEAILDAESHAVRKVVRGELELPFAKLIRHITFAEGGAHVVTSNYDRLIEFATEMAGSELDTGFVGYNYGRFAPSQSRDALSSFTPVSRPRPGVQRRLRSHVALHKPHGSLDWFLNGSSPVRCTVALDAARLMITPGTSKYRRGYDSPFDYQRAEANRAIDAAARFLVIGYGFNDDQLETHLRRKLQEGRPCVLLTKALTDNARRLVQENPSVMALIEHGPADGVQGTCVLSAGAETVFENVRIWNLSTFVREVLE